MSWVRIALNENHFCVRIPACSRLSAWPVADPDRNIISYCGVATALSFYAVDGETSNTLQPNKTTNKLVLILAHEYTHAGWMATARTLRTWWWCVVLQPPVYAVYAVSSLDTG